MWGSKVRAGGGGYWACILLGLTSHCLLWSQQNGPQGPYFRHQAAGIHPASDWPSQSRLLVSGQRGTEEVTPCENRWAVAGLIFLFLLNTFLLSLLYFKDMTKSSRSRPGALDRYSICQTEDGEEQRQSVSEDVNYWLTFEWTLLGLRIREMSNRCSRRAAWAIEPHSANWWHHEGREWVSEREEGRRGPSVSLQVHALSLTQYQTVSSMRLPINIPRALSSPLFISFSLFAQNPQRFIKWSTVLFARPRAKQSIDPKSLFK